jgi:hypothetical protein
MTLTVIGIIVILSMNDSQHTVVLSEAFLLLAKCDNDNQNKDIG